MRTRRRWLLALLLVTAIGVGVFWWVADRPPRITQASYDRIRRGMTLAEAEAIIGAPPGIYGGDPLRDLRNTLTLWNEQSDPEPPVGGIRDFRAGEQWTWYGPNSEIDVALAQEGCVSAKRFREVVPMPADPWWRRGLAIVGIHW